MASLTDIFVTVKPDMDKFGPEVKRKLASIDSKAEGSKVAGRFGVGFNGAFGGIVKHSAGLFVGAFAVIKGAQVFGGFINDARESAKVSRLSAAVIASTGGVAKITASQMGDLAAAISNKTGADDEAIQSGENLLATFTSIRNQSGKGNDIFNQATASAVDLAAAMNNGVVDANGLKSANIQLGKALNDPVKGVTALSKVGVSFTAQQKTQIKTMVASGNVLGAQKLILAELGKEFGGAAAAAADPLSRLQTITGNLAEKVGGFLLPVVDKFATWVGDTAIPKVSAFSDVFVAKVTPALQAFGGFINDQVLPRLAQFAGFIKDQILPRLLEFGGFFAAQILPKLQQFAGFLASNIVPAVQNLITAFTPLAKDIGQAVVSVFQKLAPVVVSLGTSIVSTVLPAIKDFTKFLSDNKTLVGAVAVGVGAMVTAFAAYKLTLGIVSVATKAYAVVQGALNVVMSLNPIGVIVLALVGLAAGLIYAYKKSETFRDIVNAVFGAVRDFAVGAFEKVTGAVLGAIDWVKANWPLLLAIITGPIGLAVLAIVKNWDTIKTTAGNLMDGIKTAFQTGFQAVVGFFLGLVQNVIDGAAAAFGWVPGLGGKLKTAATEFTKFRDNVNTALSGVKDKEVKVTPIVLAAQQNRRNSVQKRLDRLGNGLATGGPVFGAGTGTSDSIPAMLSNGEHVWTAREVKKAGGHSAVEHLRKTVMGFAKGGPVAFNIKTPLPSLKGTAANIGQMVATVAQPLVQSLANAFIPPVTSTPGPGGGVERWRGVALSALAAAGGSASWINSLLRRMNQESGGNPKAINLTDSNAQAGHPSQGLMQTIPGTFNAYAGKYRSRGITDPFANIFAAIRYTMDRYGSGPAGWDRPGGYSRGGKVGSLLFDGGRGYLPTGTSLVQNNTGKPEPLTRTDQALDLSDQTVRALGNVFAKALSQGRFRMVNSGGGAYVLQASNG